MWDLDPGQDQKARVIGNEADVPPPGSALQPISGHGCPDGAGPNSTPGTLQDELAPNKHTSGVRPPAVHS
jgi:hypothetical protein